MSDLRIREASAGDLEAVQALLAAASLPLDGVTDFFPDNYAIGVRGEEIVAAIGVESYDGHGLLRSAVVAESARGTGIGSRLTRERLDWSREQGLRDIYLLTTTAAAFFEKLGFVPVDRGAVPGAVAQAPEFAAICPSTATVMRRELV